MQEANKNICNLSIGYWNINGYNSKFLGCKLRDAEFLEIIGGCDIIGLGELQCEEEIDIEGYVCKKQKIREKTTKGPKISGGIGVFVKRHLSHLVEVAHNENKDSIWVILKPALTQKSQDVYLGTYYVSPDSRGNKNVDFFKTLNDEINTFSRKGLVLLQGDLNARTSSDVDYVEFDELDPILGQDYESQGNRNSQDKRKNPRGEELLDLYKGTDLLIANGRKPGDLFGKYTCHNWNGSSVVDYMIASKCFLENIIRFSVGSYVPWLSDHCLVKTDLLCGVSPGVGGDGVGEHNKIHPGFIWDDISIDNFKENLKKLSNEVKIKSWLCVPDPDPSVLAENIKNILWNNALMSDLKSKKSGGEKKQSAPWFDKECRESKERVSELGKRLESCPGDQAVRNSVFASKKYFRKIVLAKKRRYKKSMISDLEHKNSGGRAKEFWKTLRKISPKNKRDNVQPSITEFENYFKRLSASGRVQDIPDIRDEGGPLDFLIALGELQVVSRGLKGGKAHGYDNISNEMIAVLVEIYPEIVLKLFNGILKSGKSVPDWGVGMIVPIHKDGARLDPSNYRGITLMSCLGKLFLAILNARLIKYVAEKDILGLNQLGFVLGNRTSDAHLIINTIVGKFCHKKNSKIFSCFVDFRKAFDSVPRDVLLKKLLGFGVGGKFFNVIRDIYTSDRACVKLGGARSSFFDLSIGVRQGCILSPLLFNIFLSDLAKKFIDLRSGPVIGGGPVNSIFWADDLVMFAETEDGLGKMLKILEEYCGENGLTINTKKTKCMTFNKGGRLISRDFFLNGARLENVRSYKYLGFVLTPSGEINTGLRDLRDRGFRAFMKIKRDFGESFNQNIPTALLLFDSLIKPIILYCSDFWGSIKVPKSTPIANLYEYMGKYNPVEKLYTSICKQIIGVQKQTTNVGVLLELGLVPLFLYSTKFAVKNWERIKYGRAGGLLISAFRESCVSKLPWTDGIDSLLDNIGMTSFRLADHSDKPVFVFGRVFQRMSDIFHQNSFEKISCISHKLRTYALFKRDVGFESYLVNVKNVAERQLITRFRLSNHRLMIEVGRHRGLGKEERVCPFCPNYVEDEFHFLLECEIYENQRENFLYPIIETIPGFLGLTRAEKIEILMCEMDKNICKYISNSLAIRDFLGARPKRRI